MAPGLPAAPATVPPKEAVSQAEGIGRRPSPLVLVVAHPRALRFSSDGNPEELKPERASRRSCGSKRPELDRGTAATLRHPRKRSTRSP